jgi:hypothetical protein
MKEKHVGLSFKLLSVIVIAATSVYYFLLNNDNCFHSSIACIMASSRYLALKKHLLILGLLPVYIASIVFGSVYLASFVTARIGKLFSKKAFSPKQPIHFTAPNTALNKISEPPV